MSIAELWKVKAKDKATDKHKDKAKDDKAKKPEGYKAGNLGGNDDSSKRAIIP